MNDPIADRRHRTFLEESEAELCSLIHTVTCTESDNIIRISQEIAGCLNTGHKILLAGNGGSHCDAEHIATEFLVRFKKEYLRGPLPAIVLGTNSSYLTACGNDLSFDDIFSRSLQAFYRPGDIYLCLSTSGNSPNIVKSLQMAKQLGCPVIGLLGNSGGDAKLMCEFSIVVNDTDTGRVQSIHRFLYHSITDIVERMLNANGSAIT